MKVFTCVHVIVPVLRIRASIYVLILQFVDKIKDSETFGADFHLH
jgi:hypothetical protein